MVTWRERGAVGCSKCRHIGCRRCFNMKTGQTSAVARNNSRPKVAQQQPARKRQLTTVTSSSSRAKKATQRGSKASYIVLSSDSSSEDDDSQETESGHPETNATRSRLGRSMDSETDSSSSDESNQENADSSGLDSSCSESDTPRGTSKKRQLIGNKVTNKETTNYKPKLKQAPTSDTSQFGSMDDSSSEDSSSADSSSDEEETERLVSVSRSDIEASLEIDRLLKQANDEFAGNYPLDPHDTLNEVKAKWGCAELLAFLEASMCKYCHAKLGM